ncbi:DNase I-like protein, partial [Auricularia subglabra TFB-10046 SS5]
MHIPACRQVLYRLLAWEALLPDAKIPVHPNSLHPQQPTVSTNWYGPEPDCDGLAGLPPAIPAAEELADRVGGRHEREETPLASGGTSTPASPRCNTPVRRTVHTPPESSSLWGTSPSAHPQETPLSHHDDDDDSETESNASSGQPISWASSEISEYESEGDDGSDESDTENDPQTPDVGNQPNGSRKKTKACLMIASENIRGRGSQSMRGNMKWKKLAEDMRSQRIGIMAIQETHLSEEHVEDIQTYHSHLLVENSPCPDNPTGAGGIALVFNKLITNYNSVVTKVLVPGRALFARIEWHKGRWLRLLAVYASTDRVENHNMWEEIRTKMEARSWNLGLPDIVLGDFNFVEDPVDRFPAELGKMDKPPAFSNLKRFLKIKDGWRSVNPNATDWSWRDASRQHMSRLDRIYMSENLLSRSRDWDITISGITKNDHSRVSTKIYALGEDSRGKGRWAMKESLTRDSSFLATANKLIAKAYEEIKTAKRMLRRREHNAQTIWQQLKIDIRSAARKRTTEINCKRLTRMRHLLSQRKIAVSTLREAPPGERVAAERTLRKAEEALQDEKDRDYHRTFSLRSTKAWTEAETMSKSWFRWIKERKKNEDIPFLAKPGSNPPEMITNARRMAECAGEYHDKAQQKDLDIDPAERARAIKSALASVTTRLSAGDRQKMAASVCRTDIAMSIRRAKNGKAAGTDGIIHELWKALHSKFEAETKETKVWTDIAGVMAEVFQDIEDNGISEESKFTEGW